MPPTDVQVEHRSFRRVGTGHYDQSRIMFILPPGTRLQSVVDTIDGDITDDFDRMGSTQLWLSSSGYENDTRMFAVSIQDAD